MLLRECFSATTSRLDGGCGIGLLVYDAEPPLVGGGRISRGQL